MSQAGGRKGQKHNNKMEMLEWGDFSFTHGTLGTVMALESRWGLKVPLKVSECTDSRGLGMGKTLFQIQWGSDSLG